MSNKIKIEVEVEDVLNLLTTIEYLRDDLKNIDCVDFDCNGYDLLKQLSIIEKFTELTE